MLTIRMGRTLDRVARAVIPEPVPRKPCAAGSGYSPGCEFFDPGLEQKIQASFSRSSYNHFHSRTFIRIPGHSFKIQDSIMAKTALERWREQALAVPGEVLS